MVLMRAYLLALVSFSQIYKENESIFVSNLKVARKSLIYFALSHHLCLFTFFLMHLWLKWAAIVSKSYSCFFTLKNKVKANLHCTDEAQNKADTRVCSYIVQCKNHLFMTQLAVGFAAKGQRKVWPINTHHMILSNFHSDSNIQSYI